MGEATIVFTNEELKKHRLITIYGGNSINILATVIEDLTNIQRNASAHVSQIFYSYRIPVKKFGWKFLEIFLEIEIFL